MRIPYLILPGAFLVYAVVLAAGGDMVGISDIGWGSYSSYEGPLYWGKQRYRLPASPTEGERILNIITTTEGGTYDAYNGYDKCICTSGLIQWCDRAPLFLVCNLLGAVAQLDVELLAPVTDYMNARGYTFGRTPKGEWRFWRTGDGDVVDVQDKQRILYFGGASGLKGQWNDLGQKHVAKEWAAACSSVWQREEARRCQRVYTIPRVMGFATQYAKGILDAALQHGGDIGLVFRAAYLSFAANNPRLASDSLKKVTGHYGIDWDRDWLLAVLKSLTFGPGVAIYPHRYNKIRPVLEVMYGIDLPDLAAELKVWSVQNSFRGMLTTESLQQALLKLEYDLGPAGADGVFGNKTRNALYQFEVDSGVPFSHRDGYPDRYTLPYLEQELEQRGLSLDWVPP